MKRVGSAIFYFVGALAAAPLCPLSGAAWSEEQAPTRSGMTAAPAAIAAMLTAVNIPARLTLCGLSTGLASVVMVVSGGRRYDLGGEMIEAGCAGPWIITPEMVVEDRPPKVEPRSAVWQVDNLDRQKDLR